MAALGLCYWAWALSHCGVGATLQLQCAGLVALRQVGSSWTRDRTYVLSIGRQILKHGSPSSNLYVLCFWNLKWSRVTDSRSFYFFLIEFAICCSKPCSGSSAWREDSRFVCSTRRQNNTHCSTDARSGEAVRAELPMVSLSRKRSLSLGNCSSDFTAFSFMCIFACAFVTTLCFSWDSSAQEKFASWRYLSCLFQIP